jgi:hypothetical protein
MSDKPKQDDPEQSKRFIETAKKAEADETEAGAERAFKKIAASKRHGAENTSRRK